MIRSNNCNFVKTDYFRRGLKKECFELELISNIEVVADTSSFDEEIKIVYNFVLIV